MSLVPSGPILPPSSDGVVFATAVRFEPPAHVVAMFGELDHVSRAEAAQACTAPGYVTVVVDMTALAFMDCAGYRALAESRTILRERGGSLSVRGPRGEPLRLLTLIELAGRPDRAPGPQPPA